MAAVTLRRAAAAFLSFILNFEFWIKYRTFEDKLRKYFRSEKQKKNKQFFCFSLT